MSSYRLQPLDGLRTVAVFGVIWAHVWAFGFGAPSLRLPGLSVDWHKLISVIGTGVDLFFVLSGFCIYKAFLGLSRTGTWYSQYITFLKKRWLRIAPAYYAAVLVALALGPTRCWKELLAHLFFLQGVLPDTGHLWAPFWSLATEAHFYLVLPIFMAGMKRWGALRTLLALIVVALLVRCWFAFQPLQLRIDFDKNLATRLIEFLWGMLAAVLWKPEATTLWDWKRGLGLGLFGIVVAAVGRFGLTKEFVEHAGLRGSLAYCFSIPLLSLGYGLVLWSVLRWQSPLSVVLSIRPMQVLGRLSYSLYLWHWPVCLSLADLFGGATATPIRLRMYLTLMASVVILTPVSALSYVLFEAFYFRKKPQSIPMETASSPTKRT